MFDLPEGPALWTALAKIIMIDIVLSGDNAVVIALAARALPEAQSRLMPIHTSSPAPSSFRPGTVSSTVATMAKATRMPIAAPVP